MRPRDGTGRDGTGSDGTRGSGGGAGRGRAGQTERPPRSRREKQRPGPGTAERPPGRSPAPAALCRGWDSPCPAFPGPRPRPRSALALPPHHVWFSPLRAGAGARATARRTPKVRLGSCSGAPVRGAAGQHRVPGALRTCLVPPGSPRVPCPKGVSQGRSIPCKSRSLWWRLSNAGL